jgi:hypothetical protein
MRVLMYGGHQWPNIYLDCARILWNVFGLEVKTKLCYFTSANGVLLTLDTIGRSNKCDSY